MYLFDCYFWDTAAGTVPWESVIAPQEFVPGIDKPLWDLLAARQFNFKCATHRFGLLSSHCLCLKTL